MLGYLTILRRHLALVVLLGVAGVLVGAAVAAVRDPGYEATATVQLEQVESPFRSSGGTRGDLTRAILTQIDIAMGDEVRELVRAELGYEPVVSVTAAGERDELEFRAVADTGEAAAAIANAWALSYVAVLRTDAEEEADRYLDAFQTLYDRVFTQIAALDAQRAVAVEPELTQLDLQREVLVTQLRAMAGRRTPDGTTSAAQILASPVRLAQVPDEPISDGGPRLIALGLFGGLVLGYLLACLKEARRDEVRTSEDVALVAPGTAVLGPLLVGDDVAVLDDPVMAADFQSLRAEANALADTPEQSSVLAVTSATGEGSVAEVAAGLAVSLSRAGRRVVLLDADLVHPRQHVLFSSQLEPGLTNVLDDRLPLDAALIPVPSPGGAALWLLPAGGGGRSDLLAAPLFRDLVQAILADPDFDTVVIATSQLLDSPDALAVAEVASSVLVVATPRRTRRRQLGAALNRLALAHPPMRAVVLAAPREASPDRESRLASLRRRPATRDPESSAPPTRPVAGTAPREGERTAADHVEGAGRRR